MMSDIPSDEVLRKITGEEDVRLLPFRSSNGPRATMIGISRTSRVFSIYRRAGAWVARERPISDKGNPSTFVRHMGRDSTISLSRALALAFLGDPPFESAEAAYDGDRPTADNVRWTTHRERMIETMGIKPAGRGKKVKTIQISNALAAHLLETEDAKVHGLGYAAEKIIRSALGLEPLPTPAERKARKAKGSKRAGIVIDVRSGETDVGVLAARHGTTPAYAKRVLEAEGISLREIRARRRREQAIKSAQRKNRDKNIIHDAESGLYTMRELSERYHLSRQHIQSILNREGVSLLEAQQRLQHERQRSESQ